MISTESGWLPQVEKTQSTDIPHLYNSILPVIYERMVLGHAITTM